MCLRFSSRTDKGVNALGNTLSFYTPMDDGQTLLRALNAVSCGVYYRSFCFVDDGFNIRHASSRSYRYILPSPQFVILYQTRDERVVVFLGAISQIEHWHLLFYPCDKRRFVV
jgi:tRNA pseudouridine(38-40) synthase